MTDAVTPFRLDVPEAELDDLRARLARTRWPEPETVDDASQGVPLAWLQDVCRTWAEDYDWRRVEARLNAAGQFRTRIDGLDVHGLLVRSPEPSALPLLMTHGWPGSVVEFLDVLGPLTDPAAHGGDPADAFHVVCPSLPGFAFSGKPERPGWGVGRIAAAWAQLMGRLGHERYVAQGGDWGAIVTMELAGLPEARPAGIHLTMPLVGPEVVKATTDPTPRERAALERATRHRRLGRGYSMQQATRPQTLGYGLVDSPAGQCAWILEKFWEWTDHDGDLEQVIAREILLDNVMLYWLPATGASSARLYWEHRDARTFEPIDVPTAISSFPEEIFPISRRWAEQRFRDLRHFGEFDRGGHFASLERPDVFVDEVRTAFRSLR